MNLNIKQMEHIKIEERLELPVKRLYLDDVTVLRKCPFCGYDVEIEFGVHYLSYPVLNEIEPHYCCCRSCDNEFEVEVKLTADLYIGEAQSIK